MFRGSWYSPNENVWRLSSQPQSVRPRSAAGRIVITQSSSRKEEQAVPFRQDLTKRAGRLARESPGGAIITS
jgi:hypothetical protein